MAMALAGIATPDSKLAREVTELVWDTGSPLLFHHSARVYFFANLAGKRRGLSVDSDLLYTAAMFHDMGVTHQHCSTEQCFEVNGANAARDFLRRHGVAQYDLETVWTAIALQSTPGIAQHMHPVIALLATGVDMDVRGFDYPGYSDDEREAIARAHPPSEHFKHKPQTSCGEVKLDMLADKDAPFRPLNFRGGLAPWQLRVAKELIDSRLDGDLTLTDLAAACRLSVSHFSRAFTRTTGTSPHRWLMQCRLERAKALMLRTDSSIVDIALLCGFADQGHLTRSFSRAFGISPARWRKASRSRESTSGQSRNDAYHPETADCPSRDAMATLPDNGSGKQPFRSRILA